MPISQKPQTLLTVIFVIFGHIICGYVESEESKECYQTVQRRKMAYKNTSQHSTVMLGEVLTTRI